MKQLNILIGHLVKTGIFLAPMVFLFAFTTQCQGISDKELEKTRMLNLLNSSKSDILKLTADITILQYSLSESNTIGTNSVRIKLISSQEKRTPVSSSNTNTSASFINEYRYVKGDSNLYPVFFSDDTGSSDIKSFSHPLNTGLENLNTFDLESSGMINSNKKVLRFLPKKGSPEEIEGAKPFEIIINIDTKTIEEIRWIGKTGDYFSTIRFGSGLIKNRNFHTKVSFYNGWTNTPPYCEAVIENILIIKNQ